MPACWSDCVLPELHRRDQSNFVAADVEDGDSPESFLGQQFTQIVSVTSRHEFICALLLRTDLFGDVARPEFERYRWSYETENDTGNAADLLGEYRVRVSGRIQVSLLPLA